MAELRLANTKAARFECRLKSVRSLETLGHGQK